MDQQQLYYQPSVKKNAAYFRERARNSLKGFYGYALLAAFLASLLGGISSGFSFNFNFGINTSTAPEGEVAIPEPILDFFRTVKTGDISLIFESYPWLIGVVVIGVVAVLLSLAFSLFVSAPVTVGYQRYNLNLMDGAGQKEVGVLFRYFKVGYFKTIGLRVLYGLISFACAIPMLLGSLFLGYASVQFLAFVIAEGGGVAEAIGKVGLGIGSAALMVLGFLAFLAGSLITIVLSFVVQYRYALSFLILAEYPELRVVDALRNSATLMRGKKWKLFCLQISFIGWILLAVMCTCGIGMFFLLPYMNAATAAFYDDAANREAARETEFPSLDTNDYIVD